MAAPLLSTLSRAARIAYPVVLGGVAEGLSANSIGRILSEQGLGLRRSDLLSLVRQVKGVEQSAARLRTLRESSRPDPSRLPEAVTKLRNRYSFDLEVRGVNIGTGEPIVQHVTITTPTVPTRGELESMAQELVEGEVDRYGVEVDTVQLMGGRKAGTAGVL